jgi:malonyl-ACP decarboxylase
VSGLGVTASIGSGRQAVTAALLEGRQSFGVMSRAGRQLDSAFIGAEIDRPVCPPRVRAASWRSASLTGQAALVVLAEAWEDAELDSVEGKRIGLVIGGSNIQQREMMQLRERYRERLPFISPGYAIAFMDSDLCGLCTAEFNIRGLAYSLGAASASGQAAIQQACQAVNSGEVDVCIAVGALMDLSYWECHAFRSVGAMGSDRFAHQPMRACRPFDRLRDGFIFGECCGAVVIERPDRKGGGRVHPYAIVRGWATVLDGTRGPEPSLAGEVAVIREALAVADLKAEEIDYVNPHGSGSVVGDEVELEALRLSSLRHARLNATKALFGHGLTAAGTVEFIATVLQMQAGRLHPTRNLEEPIDEAMNWVGDEAISHCVQNALNISIGFGGINTAICLSRYQGSNREVRV